MKPSRTNIERRTGGVIKFRKPHEMRGVPATRPMMTATCQFCCEHKTSEQICTTRGTTRRGRKFVTRDINWNWICDVCKIQITGIGS